MMENKQCGNCGRKGFNVGNYRSRDVEWVSEIKHDLVCYNCYLDARTIYFHKLKGIKEQRGVKASMYCQLECCSDGVV